MEVCRKMQGDRIISALIGLVGAMSNNGKTERTDSVVREAFLRFTLFPYTTLFRSRKSVV